MIRVLLLSPPGWAPVRYYRGEGAMLQLWRIDPSIEVVTPRYDEIWKDLIACDIVYCFRTFDDRCLSVAQKAKDLGKKIWFDLDDAVWALEPSHPSYAGYGPKTLQIIEWFVQNSDKITVSTKEIKKRMMSDCEVIPNALDFYTLKYEPINSRIENQLHWRGGASHAEDLYEFREEMGKHITVYHGFNPPWHKRKHFPYVFDYFQYIQDLFASCVVVPLIDNVFNRCKSNIAALEAIYAGAIPIVPAWEEWEFPERYAYSTKEEFSARIEEVLALSFEEYRAKVETYRKWVKENRSLEIMNKRRVEIVGELCQPT